uniref:Uncharacterized protein n=2 Tax=Pyramimonas obovata TaxID=1411642 RepID=A0A7S0WK38_9CHLO|mmetsp:Transcript_28220/g.61844  ORF Transcript_28220/g.61844 Transcript_28220/m.61844 type:complete len:214 (+) Transcript_28220:419-1060(+)|eukprot:CAMPEP_0118934346 /NCGR_PEP_ID=MMETSP1169-20130426/13775_1 /TAXON_ID=36882 /ORGANISM="Pyramimonas obovata, Strain CCMP722" /LENGTH=213 /DNA_ID=CAMNT_0006877241 /DNA_START=419 /DNA_END=1060 /DNA_ORIENTATION=+
MASTYSIGSCIRSGALQRFASVARFRVLEGQRTLEVPTLTRGFFVGSAPWKQAGTKTKAAAKPKEEDQDEDLFESMLGDWDGHDDDGGKVVKIKPGDVHEGVDDLGSFGAAGGAVVATLAALVIFAGGTALVMGAVRSLSTLKPEETSPAAGSVGTAPSSASAASAPLSKEALELELSLLRQGPGSEIVDARKAAIKAQLKVLALNAKASNPS